VNLTIALTPGGNWPVLYKSVLQEPAYRKVNRFTDQLLKQYEGPALYWPSGVNSGEVAQDLADQISSVLAGGQDAKSALDNAQQSWESQLQSA
jgi:ABC-type glycerol-3-phosphate transport system substrate-binding protein